MFYNTVYYLCGHAHIQYSFSPFRSLRERDVLVNAPLRVLIMGIIGLAEVFKASYSTRLRLELYELLELPLGQ